MNFCPFCDEELIATYDGSKECFRRLHPSCSTFSFGDDLVSFTLIVDNQRMSGCFDYDNKSNTLTIYSLSKSRNFLIVPWVMRDEFYKNPELFFDKLEKILVFV